MFCCKSIVKRKGSILINTLLLGALCLVVSFYLFTLELQEYKNTKIMKRYVTKVDINQENYEYLLTDLTSLIYSKAEEKNLTVVESSIRDMLTQSTELIKIWHNNSFILYNRGNDCFVISSYFDEYYHREDIYDYCVESGKFKCSYRNTSYVLGKVKQ